MADMATPGGLRDLIAAGRAYRQLRELRAGLPLNHPGAAQSVNQIAGAERDVLAAALHTPYPLVALDAPPLEERPLASGGYVHLYLMVDRPLQVPRFPDYIAGGARNWWRYEGEIILRQVEGELERQFKAVDERLGRGGS